jgi:hypothetical protein
MVGGDTAIGSACQWHRRTPPYAAKLCALPTAFWAIIHFDLQPGHGYLLGLIQRRSPGLKRIDEEITRLGRAAKGDRVRATGPPSTRGLARLPAPLALSGAYRPGWYETLDLAARALQPAAAGLLALDACLPSVCDR